MHMHRNRTFFLILFHLFLCLYSYDLQNMIFCLFTPTCWLPDYNLLRSRTKLHTIKYIPLGVSVNVNVSVSGWMRGWCEALWGPVKELKARYWCNPFTTAIHLPPSALTTQTICIWRKQLDVFSSNDLTWDMIVFPAWHPYDQTTACSHAVLVSSRKAATQEC